MSAAIPDFSEAEREAVDTLLLRRYGQPTPIEPADADRYGTGRETHSDPRDCATTRRRVNVPLVPADARAAAEGTGIAR